jgi:hypothetical protein
VPFSSQSFGEQSAEAGAGTGDENYLFGIHNFLPIGCYGESSLMPDARQVDTIQGHR